MGITPGGIHDQNTRVITNGLGESLRAVFDDDVAPTKCARVGGIQRRSAGIVTIKKFRNSKLGFEARFALL